MTTEMRSKRGEPKPRGLWMKCREAADCLGLTSETINALVREQRIPGKVIAGAKRTRVLVSVAWVLSQGGATK